MDGRLKNGVRNLFAASINRIVLMVLPFVARTVLVKTLGGEYLGLSGLFTSILNVLNLSELGFGSALVYSMYKPIAQNDTEKVGALLNLYKKVYKWIGIIIFATGILCMPFLPYLIKGGTTVDVNIYILFLIYLINVVSSYEFLAYRAALFTAYQRSDVKSNISSIFNILVYGIQITVLVAFKNYYAYIIWLPLLTIAENLYTARLAKKYFPDIKCKGSITKAERNEIKEHIKGLALQKICSASRNSFDSIVISMFLGLVPIAIYNNYYFIMYNIHIMLYQIPNAIRASVGNSIAIESQKKNFSDFNQMNLLYMCLSGICCTCLICLYQPFMKIWMGEDMVFPFSTMVLFGIYFVELSFSDIISLYKDGAGLWWKGRYRTVLEAVINLILNFLLGWLFGVNGILVATIFSMALIGLGYGGYIIFKYYFTSENFIKYAFQQFGLAALILVGCIISYLICSVIPSSGYVEIIIKLIISVLVSVFLYWIVLRKTEYYKDSMKLMNSLINTVIHKI